MRFKGHDDGKKREKWKKGKKSWLTGPIGEDDVGGVGGICAVIGPSVQGLSARADHTHALNLTSSFCSMSLFDPGYSGAAQYALRVPCLLLSEYLGSN